jgi:hypothetical protein
LFGKCFGYFSKNWAIFYTKQKCTIYLGFKGARYFINKVPSTGQGLVRLGWIKFGLMDKGELGRARQG